MQILRKSCVFFTSICFLWSSIIANASVIRDTEIDYVMQKVTAPIFDAAQFEPNSVKIVILNNPTYNAFVMSGKRIYLHTGLILKAEHVGQLIGVVAHETGHIVAGHFSRNFDLMEDYYWQNLFGMVVGLAAAIASKRGDAGFAVTSATQSFAAHNMMKHRRENESSADAHSIELMNRAGISSKGLVELFEELLEISSYRSTSTDPYMRSHPLTQDRIMYIEPQVKESEHYHKELPVEWEDGFKRVQAKLRGFLSDEREIEQYYPEVEKDLYSRYAWSIAYFKQGDLKKSIKLIDGLIKEHPKDPYFFELKGQILFESGYVEESFPYFQKTISMLPEAPLPKLMYAHALVESSKKINYQLAIKVLSVIKRKEARNPFFWKLLSIAYWKLDKKGESALALAERAIVMRNAPEAVFNAKKALKYLDGNSQAAKKAKDILSFIAKHDKNKK